MNSVILLGRLTKDVELSQSDLQASMARFTIAVDKQLSKEKKQQLESENKPTADFINCVAWGKLATTIQQYTGKGKRILVNGRIQTGSYEVQDGSRRYTTDIVASSVEFIDWKERDGSQSAQRNTGDDFFERDYQPINDDRIPF